MVCDAVAGYTKLGSVDLRQGDMVWDEKWRTTAHELGDDPVLFDEDVLQVG